MDQQRDPTQEILEWFGLRPADFLVYASFLSAGATFFLANSIWDAVLSFCALTTVVLACVLGMKRDPRVSDFANFVKLTGYIPFALIVVAGVVIQYLYFRETVFDLGSIGRLLRNEPSVGLDRG